MGGISSTSKIHHLLPLCCPSTRAMNASNSARESKCVLSPDTTCSTRLTIWPWAMSVLVRKCTTNARWTDNGAFSACGCATVARPLHVSLAITPTVCKENTNGAKESLRKTLGLLWDYFGMRRVQKMQTDQLLTFGPYRFFPQTGQLWRGTQEVRLTQRNTTRRKESFLQGREFLLEFLSPLRLISS